MTSTELANTINDIAIRGKGILAADESTGTIGKRFDTINTESTEEARRSYRSLLCTTPGAAEYVSGVILFEETLGQKTDDGTAIPAYLNNEKIVPGIKVDKGLVPLAGAEGEKVTQGLDGLPERLVTYKEQGARFAKWREVYSISETTPSAYALDVNAEMLARYAVICQEAGIVPIVEPEVLMDGPHDLARSEEVTEAVLQSVFSALYRHGVTFEHMILKPSMVIQGSENKTTHDAEQIAEATIRVLRRTVPAAVPTINFLSGGQSAEEATLNLNAINSLGNQPWLLTFSYGRALQAPALTAWQGKAENKEAAQQAYFKRAKLNALASMGEYNASMEA